ncbi:MAG: HlyD family efflux transporter periplasmic adaptor subunit [Limisphaerales bacterium]
MKLWFLPLVAALVLTAATVSIVRSQPVRSPTPPPVAPPASPFPARVAAVGLVEPSSESISLSAHLPGVVAAVFVGVGDAVTNGQPLVKLDTRALESALEVRRAELAAAEAAVDAAEARATRARAELADRERLRGFAEPLADSDAISVEELAIRRGASEIAGAALEAARAEIATAQAAVEVARAAIGSLRTDLDRSVVHAPLAGQVLQVRIRPGEWAAAGAATPWLVLGRTDPLHVRVDIDEHEAWRVRPALRAVAQVRGNAALTASLEFVRFEPLVIPKQSLTGATTERVDTRVLQAVYRVGRTEAPLYVGQQMEVFIEAPEFTAR